jgi:hypothetical protein
MPNVVGDSRAVPFESQPTGGPTANGPAGYGIARRLGRTIKRAARIGSRVARHGWPSVVVYHGHAPGDDLLCTAVLREMRRRWSRRTWVMTAHPSLYEGNRDVDAIVPHTQGLPEFARAFRWTVRHPIYNTYDPETDRDVLVQPGRHIISIMCRAAGICGAIDLRPYIHLSDAERAGGQRVERQVAVQSSGLSASYPMLNKQWFADRFASVVEALRRSYNFVQIGSTADPLLPGVFDLRGKTTLRQSAAVLSASAAFVGNVGFLMHLARAVDCRSVIVYGGREQPSQSGYSCNENLYSPMPCAPCWVRNRCPYDRECMRRIGADAVIAAIERQVARQGTPLGVDIDLLPNC